MNLEIKWMKVPESQYALKCPYPMTPTRIVIHNTYNTPSATAEASYAIGNAKELSSHYYVDESVAIQTIPLNRNAWHAGDGGSGKGNREGICIEICRSRSDKALFLKAEDNGAKLTAKLLNQYGWGIDKVTKHQDYSGKNCPHRTLELGWERFKKLVASYLSTTPFEPLKANPERFIEQIANDVKRYAQNLLPSVTIAQAILESASGTSELAIRANALFGIKAKDDWKGQTFSKTTHEHVDGKTITITAPFRSYPSREASIKDHDAFFVTPEWRIARYERVRQATTAEDQAQALKDCGYATDPDYADKLIAVINKYDLKQYDPVMVSKEPLADQEIWVYAKASADMDDALRIVNSVSGARLVDMSITPKKAGVLVVQIGGVKDDVSDLLLSGSDRYETAAIVEAWIKSRRVL